MSTISGKLHVTALVLLVILIATTSVFALYSSPVNIGTNGTIDYSKIFLNVQSELRGCDIKYLVAYSHNDTLIAQTLASYGFNAIYVECNPFAYTGLVMSNFQDMINACKKYSLTFHVLLTLNAGTGPGYIDTYEDYGYNLTGYRSSWCTALENGTLHNSISFSSDAARNRMKQVVQTMLTLFPDIVDINLDYVRYPSNDPIPDVNYRVPYDNASETAFLAWLTSNGKAFSGNWSDYYHGGSHWTDFATWRAIPIDDMVRDIRAWALAVNSKIMITADVWTPWQTAGWTPDLVKNVLGQDTPYWISQGYLDAVDPMNYVPDLASLQYRMDNESTYWMGGTPKGPIPMVPFITQGGPGGDVDTPIAISTWLQQIDYLRSSGCNGFIIWRYAGPGLSETGTPYTDIRPYLAAIQNSSAEGAFPVFGQTSPSVIGSTITWQTSLPTMGKVEYRLTQMFTATPENGTLLPYVTIDYTPGKILSDSVPGQAHSITVPISPPFYYRIISNDTNVELVSPEYQVS
jgi:hypothetical protein